MVEVIDGRQAGIGVNIEAVAKVSTADPDGLPSLAK
jgi:hypothetical protein